MNLKLFTNISEGVYEILLMGEIGYDCSGSDVRKEIKYINDYKLADEIHIRMNGVGGSIVDGLNVVAAIYESKIPVKTFNDGLCASMFGIIFICGARRIAADFSALMLHEPSLCGETMDECEDEKTKTALTAFRDQLMTIVAKNCKKSKDEIIALFKAETWYTPNQMKEQGFCDEIETYSTRPFLREDMDSQMKIKNIAAFWNKKRVINKFDDMKEVKAFLGLNEDAKEENVLKAIQDIKASKEAVEVSITLKTDEITAKLTEVSNKAEAAVAEIVALKAENDNLKAANADFEAEKEEAKNAAIVAEVKVMADNGLIKAEKLTEALELAKANIVLFRKMIEMRPVVVPKITDQLLVEMEKPTPEGLSEAENKLADEYDNLDRTNTIELHRLAEKETAKYNAMLIAYNKKFLK